MRSLDLPPVPLDEHGLPVITPKHADAYLRGEGNRHGFVSLTRRHGVAVRIVITDVDGFDSNYATWTNAAMAGLESDWRPDLRFEVARAHVRRFLASHDIHTTARTAEDLADEVRRLYDSRGWLELIPGRYWRVAGHGIRLVSHPEPAPRRLRPRGPYWVSAPGADPNGYRTLEEAAEVARAAA